MRGPYIHQGRLILNPGVRSRNVTLAVGSVGVNGEDAVIGQLYPTGFVLVRAARGASRRPTVVEWVVNQGATPYAGADRGKQHIAVRQDHAFRVREALVSRLKCGRRLGRI